MYQYYVLYLAWWWLIEPKHVAECLIVNIDYQHVLCLLTELIYIIWDGSYQQKICSSAKGNGEQTVVTQHTGSRLELLIG